MQALSQLSYGPTRAANCPSCTAGSQISGSRPAAGGSCWQFDLIQIGCIIAQPLVATAATNQAPWIKGTSPKNITAGCWYSFKPSAGDPNGQTLRFSIAGKPTWATFSTSTGKLSGRSPTTTSGKTYSGIAIRASDGSSSATLPKFSLTIVAPATSSVTLRWIGPTQNVDESAIKSLQGYRIAYGTASRGYDAWLYVAGGSITSAVIEGLPRGQYFFAVMAVNAAGYTSAFSNEAKKWL